MKTGSPRLLLLAKLLSVLGHPLLTLPLVALYVSFTQLPARQAIFIATLLLGGVVVPIAWYNHRQVKRGRYTNFDVSDRGQRARFYPILIGLLSLVSGLLVATHQPRPVCYAAACCWLLVVSSYGVNRYIKASLHTSLSFFLAGLIYSISPAPGLLMGVFAFLISVSRLILKRHTVGEIAAGGLLGLMAGLGVYSLIGLP